MSKSSERRELRARLREKALGYLNSEDRENEAGQDCINVLVNLLEGVHEEALKPPPQDTARDTWLLTPLGSMCRSAIEVEQYEELRELANKLARRVEDLRGDNERLVKERDSAFGALNVKERERREHRDALQAWADRYALERPRDPAKQMKREEDLWEACTLRFAMRVPLRAARVEPTGEDGACAAYFAETPKCKECGGTGEVEDDGTGALGYVVKRPCPSCVRCSCGGRKDPDMPGITVHHFSCSVFRPNKAEKVCSRCSAKWPDKANLACDGWLKEHDWVLRTNEPRPGGGSRATMPGEQPAKPPPCVRCVGGSHGKCVDKDCPCDCVSVLRAGEASPCVSPGDTYTEDAVRCARGTPACAEEHPPPAKPSPAERAIALMTRDFLCACGKVVTDHVHTSRCACGESYGGPPIKSYLEDGVLDALEGQPARDALGEACFDGRRVSVDAFLLKELLHHTDTYTGREVRRLGQRVRADAKDDIVPPPQVKQPTFAVGDRVRTDRGAASVIETRLVQQIRWRYEAGTESVSSVFHPSYTYERAEQESKTGG